MSTLQKMLDHRRAQPKAKEVKVELKLSELADDETKKPETKKKK